MLLLNAGLLFVLENLYTVVLCNMQNALAIDNDMYLWEAFISPKNGSLLVLVDEDTYASQIHCSWSDWRPASGPYWHPDIVPAPCILIHPCRSRSVQPLQRKDALTRCWQSTWPYLQQSNKAKSSLVTFIYIPHLKKKRSSGANDQLRKQTC